MITTINPQQAKERFRTLPTSLQDVIFSPTTAELIERVGEKNHLNEDKIGLLANVVSNILLGFTHIEDIPEEIQKKVELPKELSATIAGELVVKLIGPLRQDIERSYAPESHVLENDVPASKSGGASAVESETTGLYPKPIDRIDPPANRVSLNMDKNKEKSPASLDKDEMIKKISPLSYGDKFSASGISGKTESDSNKAGVKIEAPKILHQETKGALPISNIPHLGLGLGDDKLGSIGENNTESRSEAKFEISGISKEQMEKFEREPLPSFMKRDIPSPRIVNYQNSTTPVADTGINTKPLERSSTSPNFPIVTNQKPGSTKVVVGNSKDNSKPPLPGTPFVRSEKKTEVLSIVGKEPLDRPDNKLISEKPKLDPAPPKKKGWLGKMWGSNNESDIESSGNGSEITEAGNGKPTPIQAFQAKKVDYKEAPKAVTATVVPEKSKELPKMETKKMEMPAPTPMSTSVSLPEKKIEVKAPPVKEVVKMEKVDDIKPSEVAPPKIEDKPKVKKSFWGSFKNVFGSKEEKENKPKIISSGIIKPEEISKAKSPLVGIQGVAMNDIKNINSTVANGSAQAMTKKTEERIGDVQSPTPPVPPKKI